MASVGTWSVAGGSPHNELVSSLESPQKLFATNLKKLAKRVVKCIGPCYNKSVIKVSNKKQKNKKRKKLIKKSIKHQRSTYNIIRKLIKGDGNYV